MGLQCDGVSVANLWMVNTQVFTGHAKIPGPFVTSKKYYVFYNYRRDGKKPLPNFPTVHDCSSKPEKAFHLARVGI